MVNLTKGSKMLVFMADQMAYTLNRQNPPRQGWGRLVRFDGEPDHAWCADMFELAHCQ